MSDEFTLTEILVAALCTIAVLIFCARAIYLRMKTEVTANPQRRQLTCPECGSIRVTSDGQAAEGTGGRLGGVTLRCQVCHHKFRSDVRRSSRRLAGVAGKPS